MIVSQVTTEVPKLPYSSFRINGCSDSNIEFTLLENLPVTKERRYCNKVLVHECISAPFEAPLPLTKAEFIATSDPCYSTFELFKSSEGQFGIASTITLVPTSDESDDSPSGDEEIGSILVQFTEIETCCLPLSMTYKLYGYEDDETKLLLSTGRIYVTPCTCCGVCSKNYWVDVGW